ncbi:hypothetical protein GCM10010275_15670 [Streptomyces litmocidini]|nr:hypothetical protein GCM10010275_15670 [Streptomyces litmocidini]
MPERCTTSVRVSRGPALSKALSTLAAFSSRDRGGPPAPTGSTARVVIDTSHTDGTAERPVAGSVISGIAWRLPEDDGRWEGGVPSRNSNA